MLFDFTDPTLWTCVGLASSVIIGAVYFFQPNPNTKPQQRTSSPDTDLRASSGGSRKKSKKTKKREKSEKKKNKTRKQPPKQQDEGPKEPVPVLDIEEEDDQALLTLSSIQSETAAAVSRMSAYDLRLFGVVQGLL